MSRLISDILNAPEPHFSHALRSWELNSGQHGHDIRLLSDIVLLRKKALTALSLDASDTTPQELFHALCQRAIISNQTLEAEIGVHNTDTPEQMICKVIAFIDTLPIQRDVWTVKHSVIKELLKKQPPKKLLKILGLRSIDSVLKRTNAHELLTLGYQVETSSWSNKLRIQYKKLKPIDFQASTSSLYIVGQERVEKLHQGGYKSSRIVVPNYETGSVLIVPPGKRFRLDVLAITLALLQTLYDLRTYSAYFRLISVKNEFGHKLQAVLKQGLPGNIHNTEIGWTVLQRHFTRSPDSFRDIEQPHLQHEDIRLIGPLEVLTTALPDLNFWNEFSHVFMKGDHRPVSMHVMDVVTNTSNQLSYENSIYVHMQQQLWEELGLRYIQDGTIRNEIIRQIENEEF